MEARDPELKKFIESITKPIHDKIGVLTLQHEEDRRVDVKNGDKRLMKEVVIDTHKELKIVCKDVAEIKHSIGFWTDINIIHQKMKKRKLYRIVLPGFIIVWVVTLVKIFTG